MISCQHPHRPPMTSYQYGCRCPRCKGAMSEYQRQRRISGAAPTRRNQRRIQGDYHGPVVPQINNAGYWYTRWRWHPLAHANGLLLIHQANLYAEIGSGPHSCTLCGRSIDWRAGLTVDHIDHDKGNNHPSNLRPVCLPCNLAHG